MKRDEENAMRRAKRRAKRRDRGRKMRRRDCREYEDG
jgi:hypothetical protein